MRAAYLVFLVAALPVPFLYHRLDRYTEELRVGQFQTAITAIRGQMELQFTYYIALLGGMRGFLSAQEVATPDEFRRYLDGLDLRQPQPAGSSRVPGLVDVGFAVRVRRGEQEEHTRSMREAGFKTYNPLLLGDAPEHFPVLYLDDLGADGLVVSGWDPWDDPVRRAAMEKARDTGNAMATDPIEVYALDPENNTPGFILYLPVFAGGVTPATQELRRARLMGYVFASFDSSSFWRGVESTGSGVLDLLVFDGTRFTGEHRIYPDRKTTLPARHASLMDGFNADGLGRTWGFFFASNSAFDRRIERALPTLVLLGGLALSVGLFRVASSLVLARIQADGMADALRDSEARFRGIFEAIPDLYFRTDLAGVLELISPSCAAILGYESSQIVGLHASARFVRPGEFEVTRHQLLAEGHVDDVEVVLRHRDGCEIPFSLTARLRRTPDGQPVGMEGILRDISARKQAEVERLRSSKLESIGLLAGGLAHDFNNILTAILSNVSLVRLSHPHSAAIGESMAEVETAVNRARDLTRQLLTFSRGGAPVRKPARLEALIRESVRFATGGSSVLSEFDLAPDLWPAEIDAGQISQVLHNLALNAVQAMSNGGRLRVVARNVVFGTDAPEGLAPGPYLYVSLVDAGPGIAPENLARIFDPYFTTKKRGSGLGLATSYSIIRRHSGRISVQSQPGSGTTVHFWLPAAPTASVPPEETADAPDAQIPAPGGGRILVVDDEEPIRLVLVRTLLRLGYQVVAVPDGEAAIETLRHARERNEAFAAAILDLTIPGGLGGKEALPRLRALQPGLPAIVSSGYSSDPVMADHRAFGFNALLAKPYPPEALAAALRETLASPN